MSCALLLPCSFPYAPVRFGGPSLNCLCCWMLLNELDDFLVWPHMLILMFVIWYHKGWTERRRDKGKRDDSSGRFTFLANVMLYPLLTLFTQEYSLMVLSSKIPCVPWSCELHHITTMRVQHGITSLETTRRKAR